MSAAAPKLYAVPGFDAERAGCCTWWRLSGDAPVTALARAWADRGLDEGQLLTPPSPVHALARAFRSHAHGSRQLSRQLGDGAGRALVGETALGDDLTYEVGLRARVQDEQLVLSPPDHPAAQAMRARYQAALLTYGSGDIGSWLARTVERLDGVRLRTSGGIYFVPQPRVSEWQDVIGAVHTATAHRVNTLPALRAEDAVQSILDALETEAEDEATELEAGLADLSARRLRTRSEKCSELQAKVARYESLLGAHAPTIADRLEHLAAAITAAHFVAAAKEAS